MTRATHEPTGRPAFLITIDTEGDNLWARPPTITAHNAAFLPRFQALAQRHGFRPTWLVNYEMAVCPRFGEFADDVLRRGAGEIGMHLHAWNSPPIAPLTPDDTACAPYLTEYPEPVVRRKVGYMTGLLEDRFQRPMRSHRGGRCGLDARLTRILVEHGYRVDCSVTPHVDWSAAKGDPRGRGGPDFRGFPALPYFMDLERIDRPGDSSLLEVPLSVVATRYGVLHRIAAWGPRLGQRVVRRLFPRIAWMMPNGRRRNLRGMLAILGRARRERWPCVEFMLHSSELMPGGSPSFPTPESIERLYGHLEILFARAAADFRGATLGEFREQFDRSPAVALEEPTRSTGPRPVEQPPAATPERRRPSSRSRPAAARRLPRRLARAFQHRVLRRCPWQLKTIEARFNAVYRSNWWRDTESVSGPGSSLRETAAVRRKLPELIARIGARSMLDIPCGDFHWMQHVVLDLERYVGADIVAAIVASNRRRFGGPGREFTKLDLTADPLPEVDLILCRDCLVHFSLADVCRALENIERSGSRYLLTTTFPDERGYREIATGLWRGLNLQEPPFSLPEPIELIEDGDPQQPAGKCLGLWPVADLARGTWRECTSVVGRIA